MSSIVHNPGAIEHAEIEAVEREIRTREPRIEFLKALADEYARLTAERTKVVKELAALRRK